MVYESLLACVLDLEKNGFLIRVREEVDPDLEMAEIQRRVFRAKGPAIFYEKVKGSPFPAVSNLFGTPERARFIFRDTLKHVKALFELRGSPGKIFHQPSLLWKSLTGLSHALPRQSGRVPVLEGETSCLKLPQIRCWPQDGGGFILLPQVYTENPGKPGWLHSNLGMYRVQMSGNDYVADKEAGLHYQIHRHIGVHHKEALAKARPLRVSIFVGGPPAHALAAAMYLPEGLTEVLFAGVLAGRRFRYALHRGFTVSADADFCITAWVDPERLKPEGPFGDHLGYYSCRHDFPLLHVESVYHRKGAIWPFTVVGRPPQEDSVIAGLVQEIAQPVFPAVIPGVKGVHAVDAAGIHPLMLAIGSERYVPYRERRPQEILTQASAILGYGPCSLAKYLMIVAQEDDTGLDVSDVEKFLIHLLERIDWRTDLHFQTCTTLDTLDYSGTGLNQGSKVVMAAAGPKRRTLLQTLPSNFRLAEGFGEPRWALPGVLVIQAPAFSNDRSASAEIKIFAQKFETLADAQGIPLVVLSDDSRFASHDLRNFLWVTFTRSNPSHDIHGVLSFSEHKHWGCEGALIIDARSKPHHAPLLVEDPLITKRVEALALPGHSLHGIL